MVRQEVMASSDGRLSKPSGWEARWFSIVMLSLWSLFSCNPCFHKVANIKVKPTWQDGRLATTEILVIESMWMKSNLKLVAFSSTQPSSLAAENLRNPPTR